jgi:hypothetical protein
VLETRELSTSIGIASSLLGSVIHVAGFYMCRYDVSMNVCMYVCMYIRICICIYIQYT